MNFRDLILQTPRLTLRPVEIQDADKLFEILKKFPFITQYLTFDTPQHVEEERQFVQQALKNQQEKSGMTWTLWHEENLIGIIGLDNIVFTKMAWKLDQAELGYWLDPTYHRQGYMYEAVQAVLRCCFESIQLHKIIAHYVSPNTASEKLLQKLGFSLVGEYRDHFWRNGRWWDYKITELLASDFLEKNES